MRTISSIRTAVLVVAVAATACSQRAEPRPSPSQDEAAMKPSGPDAMLLGIDTQLHAVAVAVAVLHLEGRPS